MHNTADVLSYFQKSESVFIICTCNRSSKKRYWKSFLAVELNLLSFLSFTLSASYKHLHHNEFVTSTARLHNTSPVYYEIVEFSLSKIGSSPKESVTHGLQPQNSSKNKKSFCMDSEN